MKEHVISKETISDFKQQLCLEEKSEATIGKYLHDIRVFAQYVGNTSITREKAVAYKQNLIAQGYAMRSVNSMIASLNSYFVFVGLLDCKLKSVKIQRQIFRAEEKELTKAEYERLLRAAGQKGNQRLNLMIQTICSTGIRVSELQFITVEAVRKGEAVVSLKGKTRTIFIVKELRKKLLRYIAEQKIAAGNVFVTRTGKPVSRSNIWREMKNLCRQAGVNPDKVFPHNLRHLFDRTFYGIEKDIAKLADILGHSSINTTRIYIMTTGNEHRRRMERMCLII